MTQNTSEPPSLGELFSELTDETRTLIKKEIELAKTETKTKARAAARDGGVAAIGIGLIAGGALALLGGVVLLLGTVMPLWTAALVIGVLVVAIGATFTRNGLRSLKRIDAAPRETVQTLEENKLWLKHQINP